MYSARGILFDLDGTLVDSFPDIAHCLNLVLVELGFCKAPVDEVRGWVGNGSPVLVRRGLSWALGGEPDEALVARGLERFLALYPDNVWRYSRLYGGVVETLEAFVSAGFLLGCVTNKPLRPANLLLEAAGIDGFFGCVVGGDSLASRKPEPEMLEYAAGALGLSVLECVMVGDSASDIGAAKAAGMPVFCLTYGYNQGLNLAHLRPDVLVDRFADIGSLVSLLDVSDD